MTVTYTPEVATCKGFGCFLKLLFRWRGSIYKLVWIDLLAFLFIFYLLNVSYRFVMNPGQKEVFESVVRYCSEYSALIPLSFVLGFYVTIVMNRWWDQYITIPWPDSTAVFVSANVHGHDERGRVMRRTIMRYVCLCQALVLINISPRVKKRFPNLNSLVEAGLLVENEKIIIESMNEKFPRHTKHWMPVVWASSIITRARKEGRIRDDFAVKTIIDAINTFRFQCSRLIHYSTISIPLVYTQVVTLAVYSYFLTSALGTQWVKGKMDNTMDLYFPFFTTLQFFFYMGWLKVAETLINPFGEDDDDFEVNWLIDRNLQVSYMIVDEMHHEHPELIRDQYWDEVFPNELPYTVAAEKFREEHPESSTAKIEISENEAMTSNLSSVKINEMNQDDNVSGIHFNTGNVRKRHLSHNSSVDGESAKGTFSRARPIASVLKRFLSRDSNGSDTAPTDKVNHIPRLFRSTSLAPDVVPPKVRMPAGGSMRITDQVIEEVDEQLTISQITQSQRGDQPSRPTAKDVFAEIDPSINIIPEIPCITVRPIYSRSQSSISAVSSISPQVGLDVSSNIPLGEQTDNFSRLTVEENNGDDDFERLRKSREKERQIRTQFKLARSMSTQPGTNPDGEQNANILFSTEGLIPSLFKASCDENCSATTGDNRHSMNSTITNFNYGEGS